MLADPARRLRDAVEPLAMHATGSPAVRRSLGELGLDRFTGYVGGRAAALGDPAPGVVVAAFGVFEPARLRAAWTTAHTACPPVALREARTAAVVASLQSVLGDADVDPIVQTLQRGLSAGSCAGRPLFGGLADQPWPDHPLGQLWRACDLLREHRGDTHLIACLSEGLDPVEMNVMTELWVGLPLGSYTATRGWHADAVERAHRRLAGRGLVRAGGLTGEGMALRTSVEQATNRGQREVVVALGDDVELLVGSLGAWSARCIAAGTFTDDVHKRAAG